MSELIQANVKQPGLWDKVRPYFEIALSRGGDKDWSLYDLYVAFATGRLTLWTLVSGGRIVGAGATTVTEYPRRQVMEIVAMGTDKNTEQLWLPLLEHLKKVASSLGCSAVVGTGRDGWARKLGAEERRVFEVAV